MNEHKRISRRTVHERFSSFAALVIISLVAYNLSYILQVYSIRDAAENNLKRLSEEFGPDWAMQHIVPQVLDMIKNPHYLYRMTVLHAISLLAPVMGSEITSSKLLPVVVLFLQSAEYQV
ncbi:putative armadillo-like helical protein [Helianthus annuus]|nr:putative armadillo-like helical protein [Helianthus annuus]